MDAADVDLAAQQLGLHDPAEITSEQIHESLQEAEGTLRQVLAYRVWFDQRRGWRYTNPNLEQLDMVRVEYLGLDDLLAGDVADRLRRRRGGVGAGHHLCQHMVDMLTIYGYFVNRLAVSVTMWSRPNDVLASQRLFAVSPVRFSFGE